MEAQNPMKILNLVVPVGAGVERVIFVTDVCEVTRILAEPG